MPAADPPEVRRVVAVNASGEPSGAEAVLLDVLGVARQQGMEIVVASPSGPLVDRLALADRHVELPRFGLGGARGRVGRSLAAARWAARTPLAAARLWREVRRPGTATLVNSLLALPAVRAARPPLPPAWLVHDTVHTALQRRVVRTGASSAWRIVAVSNATAAPLRALGFDVVVCPNGVPWPVDPAPVVDRRPPVVGTVALLTAWKGHRVLLDAVADLDGVRVELAGRRFAADGDYVDQLHARAARRDLAGRVTFLGHVDVPSTLRRWDLMVSASTSPEAGPLAVLEAMSLGVPVVATDHGGSAEYLAHGGGILVPPGDVHALRDAISAVLADAQLRRELGQAGRAAVAAHHDRSKTLPALYQALIGASGGR